MNKYFLAKHVLQHKDFLLPLDRDEILAAKYNSIPYVFDDVPEADRVLTAADYIEVIERRFIDIEICIRRYIESLPCLTGDECMQLIRQYDSFIEQTKRVIDFETKFEAVESFFLMPDRMSNIVRSLFDYADLDSIYRYEAAEKELTGLRVSTVIVNGNRGEARPFKAYTVDNTVTIEKMREWAKKAAELQKIEIESLNIDFSIYANADEDSGGECLLDRQVTYLTDTDELRFSGRDA